MSHTNNLFDKIKADFPEITFTKSNLFRWSSTKTTVFYAEIKTIQNIWTLLHEIAHSQLNHTNYQKDIELIEHESTAWHHAATVLAPEYGVKINNNFIQDYLDTYRDWLHRRSICPSCQQNGIQKTQNTYRCLNCRCLWTVNDARQCAQRRSIL